MAEEDTCVPLNISDHRFASYGDRALHNFIHNYPSLYSELYTSGDDKLDSINHSTFVFALTMCTDVYKMMSEISLKSQKVEILPWRQRMYLQQAVGELQSLSTTARNGEVLPDSKFPNFGSALKEICEKQTFKGAKVIQSRRFAQSTRSVADESASTDLDHAEKLVRKHVADMLDAIASDICTRGSDPSGDDMHGLIAKSFAIEEVCKSAETGTVPNHFEKYSELAISSGYMDMEQSPELNVLNKQYLQFANLVQSESVKFANQNPEEMEYKLYCKLINSGAHKDIADVLHLLAGAMVRSANEAPTESMGNIIKQHVSGRNVSFDAAAKEVEIHWNGPDPIIAELLVREALDHYLGKNKYNFNRVSLPGRLKPWITSKVVDRLSKEAAVKARIRWDN